MDETYKIMLVAGEASGDRHAAKLVNALREAFAGSRTEFFGAAGPRMREAGVEAVVKSDDFSVVGLPEIARALPMFLRAFRALRQAAAERRPDAVVLVDFPDFNLKLARVLKRMGLTVVYYISPQLWAWRKYRARTISSSVDLLITILPFEKDWYAELGIKHVEYVGSPLAREVHAEVSTEQFRAKHRLDPKGPIISLLPGSRHKEIVRILPVMLKAAAEAAESRTDIQFVIAAASDSAAHDIRDVVKGFSAATAPSPRLFTVVGETYDALNASDAAAVTSGTATLETGIIGTPMVIVYKTSALNYTLLRPLISVEHFGLINLIAGERVAKELIQHDFTPDVLAEELLNLLESAKNAAVRKKLRTAADRLGHGGASLRAAELIVSVIKRRKVY